MVETNPGITFNANGRFNPSQDVLDGLTTQLDVNRFLWEHIQQLDLDKSGIEISPTPPVPLPGEDLADGTFWFDNSEDVMQLFIWHEASDAWIPVAPPVTLESRVRAGELTQEAIIAQIQESLEEQARIIESLDSTSSNLDGKVSLSGTNVLDQEVAWRLRQVNVETGANNTFMTINRGTMALYNVNYPTHPEHAATMGYVDDKVDPVWEQLRQTTVIDEEHSFKFTVFNKNPRPGEFNLQDFNRNITADPDEAVYIAFSNYDFAGEQWNYDKPNDGDTIRIEYNARYLIFNILEGADGYYAVEKVEGTILNFETSPIYDFNFFIDIDPNEIAYKGYVDAAIANNRGDIDISQYPTVDYVEERLDEKADKTELDGLTDRVAEGESEQDTLKAKVNALEGALGEHRLRFTWSENNVRPGQFNLKNDVMQLKGYLSEATWIGISDTDDDGGSIDLDRITEGDVLRMSDGSGSAAELKITQADTRGLYRFEKVSGALDRMSEVHPYDFILLSSFDPSGLASIDYVDAQDAKKLNKSGGTMTGDLSLKRTDDTYWTYIRSQKPEAWNASQDTHGLIIDIGNTNSYKQQLKIQGRSGKDLFEMHDDGKAQATLLGNLDVANVLKQGGYPIATQVYVQQAVAGIEIPEAVEAERPILWKYNPDVPANSLGNGEFNLSAGLSNGAAADWSIYFAKRDARGYYWYPHDSGNEFTHEIDVQMATIRGRDQICAHGKTNKWYFNQGTNKYAQLRLSYYRSSNALASGKYYLINIPGYMPFFAFGVDAQNNGTHS